MQLIFIYILLIWSVLLFKATYSWEIEASSLKLQKLNQAVEIEPSRNWTKQLKVKSLDILFMYIFIKKKKKKSF